MYKRISLRSKRVDAPSTPVKEYECDHIYHPLSYYLNGGSDPTGEHLDMSRVTTSDSAEDIAAGCGVDARCDPRTNVFDIVEQCGVNNAKETQSATTAGEKTAE